MLVGGRAFVAYPYREAEPVPEGVAVMHIADNPEAFGREHAADMALLGDISRTLGARPAPRRTRRPDKVTARSPRAALAARGQGSDAQGHSGGKRSDAAQRRRRRARGARRAAEDAIIANDSAATFGRVQDLMTTEPGRYFFARGGVLGCSMPAAVGAALATNGWVASFVGDGGRHVFAAGSVERRA